MPTEPNLTTEEADALATACNGQGADTDGSAFTGSEMTSEYSGLSERRKRILRLLALAVLSAGASGSGD